MWLIKLSQYHPPPFRGAIGTAVFIIRNAVSEQNGVYSSERIL
jgi:hypothetical protein